MIVRIKKILILNIILCAFIGFSFTVSFAGEGSLSIPGSVNVGENFNVTVQIPVDAVGYQGEISVKFSDGTVQNSGSLTVVTGVTGDYAHPGNMSYSFKASSEGTATVTVSNLKITDKNATRLNTQTTLTGTISVVKKQEGPAQTTPSTPTQTPTQTATSTSTETSSNEPGWNNTGDKVYALERLNVRSGWGTNYSTIGKLSKGDSVTRVAVGSNGWDKITYNGQTGYVVSKYLTTKNPNEKDASSSNQENNNTTNNNTTVAEPTWTETGDKVYATTSMNVREGYGTNSSVIGGLKKGDSITRIAVGSNGWDKIKYNGKTAYVLSRLLTTKKVEPDEEVKDENKVENNLVNNTLNNKVKENTSKITANMTEEELTEYNAIVEEIGVLPTVGKNLADYIYIFSVTASILIIGFVGFKIRENNY